MASILNSISFNNFYNYYGSFEENRYELEAGVNIIVADNGAGKSKFFNAFLWLFDDQVLDSDDKIQHNLSPRILVKMISDKAKNETPIGGRLTCGIQVEYTSGERYKYQIIKSFDATRIAESITDKDSWQFVFNPVEVNRTEIILHKYKPVYEEDDKKSIIDKLISPSFRKYSFLQGEEVDKIIDFGHKESIQEAVRNLTDIKKYEELVTHTKYIKDRAFSDLTNQGKANDKQAELLDQAIASKEKYEIDIDQQKQRLTQWETTYVEAENEFNLLNKQFANAEKRKELDDKLKPLNKSLKEKND